MISSRCCVTNIFTLSLNSGHSDSLKFNFCFNTALILSEALVVNMLGGDPKPAFSLISLRIEKQIALDL